MCLIMVMWFQECPSPSICVLYSSLYFPPVSYFFIVIDLCLLKDSSKSQSSGFNQLLLHTVCRIAHGHRVLLWPKYVSKYTVYPQNATQNEPFPFYNQIFFQSPDMSINCSRYRSENGTNGNAFWWTVSCVEIDFSSLFAWHIWSWRIMSHQVGHLAVDSGFIFLHLVRAEGCFCFMICLIPCNGSSPSSFSILLKGDISQPQYSNHPMSSTAHFFSLAAGGLSDPQTSNHDHGKSLPLVTFPTTQGLMVPESTRWSKSFCLPILNEEL